MGQPRRQPKAATVEDRRTPDPRIEDLQKSVAFVHQQVAENTQLTEQTAALAERTAHATEEIVQFWVSAKGGLEVLAALGRLARPVAMIATAIAAISAAWYAVTHWGSKP